jgi:hypothetical protein
MDLAKDVRQVTTTAENAERGACCPVGRVPIPDITARYQSQGRDEAWTPLAA